MPLEQFVEDPASYTKDFNAALAEHDGETVTEWGSMRLERRLAALRQLPPDERFMFTLRDMCIPRGNVSERLVNNNMTALRRNTNPVVAAEYVLNAAGICGNPEVENIFELVPKRESRDALKKDIQLQIQRLMQKPSYIEKATNDMTDALLDLADQRTQNREGQQEQDIEFDRRIFNVRLMQTLVHAGVTEWLLLNNGMKPLCRKVLKKHQSSKLRDAYVVNNTLRNIDIETGGKLAIDYFKLYKGKSAQIKPVDCLPEQIAAETRTDAEKNKRAKIDMVLRAMMTKDGLKGIQNPYLIRSQDRPAALLALRQVLLEVGSTTNPEAMIDNLLACRYRYNCVLSGAVAY